MEVDVFITCVGELIKVVVGVCGNILEGGEMHVTDGIVSRRVGFGMFGGGSQQTVLGIGVFAEDVSKTNGCESRIGKLTSSSES